MTRYRQLRIIPTGFHQALRGIALGPQGQLWAVGDSEAREFGATGSVVKQWNTQLPAHCVAAGSDGSVWTGEIGQIEVFARGARLATVWKDPAHMGRVTSIGFLKDSVVAGDSANRCVQRFNTKGAFLNTIAKDNPLGGLHIPNGVVDLSVDSHGTIHVANPGRHRVERYSPDGKLLGHMGKFTGPDPAGFSGCCNPTNVAVAGRDRLCVTEKAGPRAKVYDYAGALLATIDSPDFDPTTRNMDVAVDAASGKIFVSDPARMNILIFEPEGGAHA